MSVLLDYNKSRDETTGADFGYRSGTITMRQPLYLNQNKRKAFRVLRVIMSPEIPNIYSYNGYSNSLINISIDGGATWVTVSLKAGIYTIQMIQDSINDVANQLNWYIKPSDPAIVISYNPATRYVYTKLDSSKLLAPGQIAIDYGVSSIYLLLGYGVLTSKFLIDGLFTATLPPQLDAQSTYVEIKMSCIQGVRWTNGSLSSSICRIPIQSGQVEIVWPAASTGLISPLIPASIVNSISSYTINITTGNGSECVFLYGNFILEVEIVDLDN